MERAPARTSATPYSSVRSTAGVCRLAWHQRSNNRTPWCPAQFYWWTCVLSAAPAPSWTAARRGRVEVWPGLVVLAGTSHLVRTSVCHADNAAAEGLLRRLRLYIHRTVWWRGVTPTLGQITLRDNILPMIIGNAGEHEGIELEQGMSRSRCAATHIHATSRSVPIGLSAKASGWSGTTLSVIVPLQPK